MLEEYQEKLIAAVRRATSAHLERVPKGASHCVRDQLIGMAVHDGYHAGQIRLLALWPERCVTPPTAQSQYAEGHSGSASQV
jgi:hypothetical protein